LAAHASNASYWVDRDQEDWSSKPAPGKQFVRSCLKKNLLQKRTGGVAQVVRVPAFKGKALSPSKP
jgi:hypothetical protein